jgi:diacylglycerol kinase family enzyme
MARIGIVNNPRSRRNLLRPETAARLRLLLDGHGEVVDASTPEELALAVERLGRAGIDVLGVNGGDGTGHRVLTALAAAYGPRPLPALLLLRGGAMNTVARANGVRGSPEALLGRHLARALAGLPSRTVERDLLRVEADDRPPVHGFLFGTGCAVAFLEAYGRSPRPSAARAAWLLARALGSVLVGGRFARDLARRQPLRALADGEEWPDAAYLAVLAGAVPEMGFGFRPFARCDEQPGFFHAVGLTGSATRVAAALPAVRLGRPWRRRVAIDAVARELLLESPAALHFTVDGDLYRAERAMRISSGPTVSVIVDDARRRERRRRDGGDPATPARVDRPDPAG